MTQKKIGPTEESAKKPAAKVAAKPAAKKAAKPAAKKASSAPAPAKTKTKAAAKAAPGQSLQAKTPKKPAVDVHAIIEQLRRGDLASRSAAASSLGLLRDPHAVSALAEALRDPTAELACEAAAALGNSTDSSALHALIAVALNSDGYFHGTVRAAAASSLGNLLDPRSVEALVAAIHDPICETSLAAIDALGKIGDGRARPALEAAVSNVNGFFLPQVQRAAADALVQLRD
jgi:HEAT repeat protein